ncbi:MAG: CapA family protein [bacterium]|nr:CapA family protein [bacterium]
MRIVSKLWLQLTVYLGLVTAVICLGIIFAALAQDSAVADQIALKRDVVPASAAHFEALLADNRPAAASLIAVGDIMLGRNVESLMQKKGTNYPFAAMNEVLTSADLAIANLEGPVVSNHQQTPDDSLSFSFPSESGDVLHENGLSFLTVANNHMLNHGLAGLVETRTLLEKSGVAPFGDPLSNSIEYVLKKNIDGLEFVLVGWNATQSAFSESASLETLDEISRESPDAFVVITVHWGLEYSPRSNARQQQLARDWIDHGANLVIGHHPHVTQEIEVYDGSLIVYSLGNFIFDQYFFPEAEIGLALLASFSDTGVVYTLLPFQSRNSQPSLMNSPDRDQWLDALTHKSPTVSPSAIRSGSIKLDY